VKGLTEVMHDLRREQVNADGSRAEESESDQSSLECHRKVSVSIRS
jgi:hypothetical protein